MCSWCKSTTDLSVPIAMVEDGVDEPNVPKDDLTVVSPSKRRTPYSKLEDDLNISGISKKTTRRVQNPH